MSSNSALTFPTHIKTVLITGASGFVGRKLVQLLLADHPQLRLITTDIHRPPTYGIEDEGRLVKSRWGVCSGMGLSRGSSPYSEHERVAVYTSDDPQNAEH
jgi:hypothetical protein